MTRMAAAIPSHDESKVQKDKGGVLGCVHKPLLLGSSISLNILEHWRHHGLWL